MSPAHWAALRYCGLYLLAGVGAGVVLTEFVLPLVYGWQLFPTIGHLWR